MKFLFKYKLIRHLLEFVIWILAIYILIFFRNLFPENDILRGLVLLIFGIGFFYFFYVIGKLIPEQKENEKKGTNPIAWFFKPTKYEKKERARLRKNARGRAKTLEKKGKGETAASERRSYGTYKKF